MADKLQEIGASGLSTSSGEVTDELNPNLQGRKALGVYRLMRDNDAVVGAILYAIEMLVRQVDWRVDQGDAKEADSTFLEEVMDDMSESWGDFITEAFSMLPFGWAFHEIVYKKRSGPQKPSSKIPSSKFSDGKIGWRKMPLRSQDSLEKWDFDEEGGVKAFVQRPAPLYQEITIPIEKGLLFRTTPYKGSPEGRSVLRSAYTSWYYKKRIQQIEGVGIERDLAGFPVFWLPAELLAGGASPEQKAVLAQFNAMGNNIRRDKQEHLIMPLSYDDRGNKHYDFELVNSSGARSFNTSEIIARYNKEIAMTVLGDFILLGHEGVGSFALSSDKTDLFSVALGTFLDIIEDVMNRYAIPRLFELNGMNVEVLPTIKHGDIEQPDLTSLGAYISALSGVGMPLFPNEDLEKYLLGAGKLPEPSEEEKEEREAKKAEEEEQQRAQFEASQNPDPNAGPAGGGGNAGGSGGKAPAGGGTDDYLKSLGYNVNRNGKALKDKK